MIHFETINLKTKGFNDIVDITKRLNGILEKSGISNGLLTVSVPGSTAGITSIEYEPGLIFDMKKVFEKIAPENGNYKHNETWGDGNGFSHVRAAITGFSRSVPVRNSELVLGTWQQIILMDFDNKSRNRAVSVQIIGE
ncbi:secondary thiamine-phosphate synthase enzyme YjbQ [Elusimicrobiota bacterium]